MNNAILDPSHNSAAQMSWWPKASTWDTGTWEQGYWTSFCEQWFQKRLDRIRSHEVGIKGARAWRDVFRTALNARKLCQAVETASEQFVDARKETFLYSI